MRLDVECEFGLMLRLHDFDEMELRQLRELFNGLASGRRGWVALHAESFIQPVEGCRFILKVGEADYGICRVVEPNLFGWVAVSRLWEPFACELTRQAWRRVMAGADLLLEPWGLCGEHLWLHLQWGGTGGGRWLLSPDGEW
jgi:hypothetical protein